LSLRGVPHPATFIKSAGCGTTCLRAEALRRASVAISREKASRLTSCCQSFSGGTRPVHSLYITNTKKSCLLVHPSFLFYVYGHFSLDTFSADSYRLLHISNTALISCSISRCVRGVLSPGLSFLMSPTNRGTSSASSI